MIKQGKFKNADSYILENDFLKAVILPEYGGKIASLVRKDRDFELLFQNKKDTYKKPGLYDLFEDYDASGFDDAFPCVDPSFVNTGKRTVEYPDHGEVWRMAFYSQAEGEKLILKGQSRILDYTYIKKISLREESLSVNYEIENTGKEDIPCIWAMHCLTVCRENMKIIFPQGTESVVNVSDSRFLGPSGKIHKFPVTKGSFGEYHLDKVMSDSYNKSEKYYVNGKVKKGSAGIFYPEEKILYKINYDPRILPYLGFWVTEGGYRGDYNCAIEPASGFYDSVETAGKTNSLFILEPEKKLSFDICIELKSVDHL